MELTNIISRNRSSGVLATATNAGAAATPAQTPRGPVTAASTLTPSKAATPVALAASRASTSRATSVMSDGRTPILSGQDAATDFRLRKRVLLANPELLALHKDLVMSGQITEAEFWEGREVGVFFCFTVVMCDAHLARLRRSNFVLTLPSFATRRAVDMRSTYFLQRQQQKTKNAVVRVNW